jgi:superfamily II DNA or RNA helicase
MLLDNKTRTVDKYYKVVDFLRGYTERGQLDLVTGFFSVRALALLYDEMNQAEQFRMILGHLMKEEAQLDRIIDLLNGDTGIVGVLQLSQSAQKAVAFLEQGKVHVKNVDRSFCHAKSYLYHDCDDRKNYYIIGSSNLTDAGLGIKTSSNIELNTAITGVSTDFRELKTWFDSLWNHVAQEKIELTDKSRVDVKQHIIEMIKKLFTEYSPSDLYYKVLYELFKKDLNLLENADFKQEIAHLEETIIYKTLFPYQRKGVISLIKMLQNFNGAILADAVGLGKTWTALAVIKYFGMKGYTVIVFCPKKLRHNWERYQSNKSSRFENDEIDYYVRNHTDLQEGRLDGRDHYHGRDEFPLEKIWRKQKLLIVIDESHNLRNDKSARYKFLVEQILLPEKKNRDVKVLQLSATPINNKLLDIRNQFKLMVKGDDHGFQHTTLDIRSLEAIFKTAQRDFTQWSEMDDRKISTFIAKLDERFFSLTDSLIVARTRKLIEGEFGEMNFPRKEPPINEYITPENIGNLKTFDDILDAFKVKLTAYKPSHYTKDQGVVSALENTKQREGFLVKMMYILLVKRLESSWYSFKSTVENILKHHTDALDKVNLFLQQKKDVQLTTDHAFNEDEQDELDETSAGNESANEPLITLGRRRPVLLSDISDIDLFKKHLEADIEKLTVLSQHLTHFTNDFNEHRAKDHKLEKLIEHIRLKQQEANKKILIFTAYKDTAIFLFDELSKRHIGNLACVTGTGCETQDGSSGSDFEKILERFAPFTKLYKEQDWSSMYAAANLEAAYKNGDEWHVPYDRWIQLVEKQHGPTLKKINAPIDILIATDCLSEGQNLQDCDLLINYDIHWNPVRLIQRMGRIDRLGSPNKTIRGINFWPSKNYEDYLQLKSRVENRMALMSVIGTEFDDHLTPELREMVKENPLLPRQAQKMLDQLQLTWDDVETGPEMFGLNDLSLEQFRQELFDFFKKHEERLKKIPNGVYTGFEFKSDLFQRIAVPDSIVAVLGYPKRPDEATDHIYDRVFLLHRPYGKAAINITLPSNHQEILSLLRRHKLADRYVPADVEQGNPDVMQNLSKAISDWVKAQARTEAVGQIQDLFSANTPPKAISPEQKKVEDMFQPDNFDLINWFIVSNQISK